MSERDDFDLDFSLGIGSCSPSDAHPSRDIRSMREKYRAEIYLLRSQIAEARAVIAPFAAIEPSSLSPRDGSEAEGYIVNCAPGGACDRAGADFTGADLAGARKFMEGGG